ncbi:hypothetical protein Droror1_Dr00007568 [Drosera rotundifolia]
MFLLGRIPRGKIKKDNLELLLSELLQSFPDRHPRVRWAAITNIAKLTVCLKLGVKVPVRVLPALVLAMDDTQNPQVQNGKLMVRMGALSALASLAQSSKESNLALRGKLLDCITTIGEVAGNGKFKDDSTQVIEALLNLQGSRLEVDHSTQSIILRVDCLPIRGDLGEAKIVHE